MHFIKPSFGLLAYSCAVFAQQITFPGTLEVDLVFPRNDTYSPTRFFPFVFAIQNPPLAVPLALSLDYVIFSFGTTDGTNVSQAISSEIRLQTANLSSRGPYFAHWYTTDLNITEGAWGLAWQVGNGNCSVGPPESGYRTDVSFHNHDKFIVFSTKKGAQMPDLDLVAATDQSYCTANNQTQTYNVTGTVVPYTDKYDGNSCAVLSSNSPSPAADPCRAKIDTAAASSISAAITAHVCAFPSPGVSCPPDPWPKRNLAVSRSLGGLRWLAVSIGWVICLLLVERFN